MTAFLKIENPGVAPAEAFTLLGASTKRGSGSRTIGKFGSGNKHGVAVMLRNKLAPVVFAGNLKMEFGTRPVNVNDGHRSHEFARVVVKYGGKDAEGVSRSATEDLGFVLEYGASDWIGIDLALREFVSNAIDRAIEEGEHRFNVDWSRENGVTSENRSDDDIRQRFTEALNEYRKTARDFQNVVVEVVNENQVRAKAGWTRVFIPLDASVLEFYNNLGKWFLHFSEPESLDKVILPKRNRNLGDRKAAVIYRRGVRVREFESSDTPSLFDYNLEDLELDEARKVDDWRVRQVAGKALASAGKDELAALFQSFVSGEKYWEHQFDTYALEPSWSEPEEKIAARSALWQSAFDAIGGSDAVLSTESGGQLAARKGYKVVYAPESFVKAANRYGVRTPDKVLTADDREGRRIVDAVPDAEAAVDFVWDVVTRYDMTEGKARPRVKSFSKIMEGGSQTLGFYRDGTVYINTDIAGYASVQGGWHALTQQLLVTAMEEVAHHVTGATDNSRDFQDYVLNLAVKLAKAQAGLL